MCYLVIISLLLVKLNTDFLVSCVCRVCFSVLCVFVRVYVCVVHVCMHKDMLKMGKSSPVYTDP